MATRWRKRGKSFFFRGKTLKFKSKKAQVVTFLQKPLRIYIEHFSSLTDHSKHLRLRVA